MYEQRKKKRNVMRLMMWAGIKAGNCTIMQTIYKFCGVDSLVESPLLLRKYEDITGAECWKERGSDDVDG
jgi:hypothetical protein